MNREIGFTLIELLVCLSIISALFAIALPQYSKYREKAFDLRAETDLRNVALAEEAYFISEEKYLACTDEGCTTLPGVPRLSKGTKLQIALKDDGFTGTSSNSRGSGKVFEWDSLEGGIIEDDS